ncbi:zinc finger transcriptional factor charlatan isoform X1 [Calliopsis andreniformis]|uniref:zinc finger transcriptional factor charlatan isoform X1 n=1 Tax=Calliopsis andreniformis TaxID=337506 RepID=UPI003FCCF8FB
MEGSGTGISRLDCYEDMFKEITRKLYGEDPDHRTSSVQNEFETSVSYKNDDDTGNGTDGSDDGNWTCEEEPLKGTDGSRIAAYHAGKATWRCYECGDVMGGGPRDVAEHFMELHSSRILADDSRNRHHSPRKDYLQSELKVEDVITYLERLRERAERVAPPSRRTQETQTVPAALLPVTSTFLLQELPSSPAPQHLHQNTTTMPTSATVSASGKRYTCPYCPYGTDRRDLYTRHENIHREEKPFHCYICYKPFNRADHVKKHFLRMHREHGYELSRIRRPAGSSAPKPLQQDSAAGTTGTANTNGQQQQQHTNYSSGFNNNKSYQLQPNPGSGATANTAGIYQATTMPAPSIMQPDAVNCNTGRRVQNGGCNSKSHLKGGSKGAQERRYTCCYCSWSGVDNWCLKRHLNTHLKPFACTLCEYKAARAERLATHVLKVHNRRQCSRCSFLGEDAAQLQMHQLHVHRVSSANAPATSTAQAPPPPNNRHQQALHPAGGGRPPPGPPVFPAPAPAIAPATTVIPPTTILGHEMVNSPATAATMAYPTLEEERRRSSEHDHDHDLVDQPKVGRRDAKPEPCVVCRRVGDEHPDERVVEPCSACDRSSRPSADTATVLNRDFACSYRAVPEATEGQSAREPFEWSWSMDSQRKPNERRSRKQSQPRKVTWNQEFEDDDPIAPDAKSQESKETDSSPRPGKKVLRFNELRKRYTRRYAGKRLLKCRLCPDDSPARGSVCRPYHTKASLALHKLWRHGRRKRTLKNSVTKERSTSQVSSITLKATVFTSPSYGYHR